MWNVSRNVISISTIVIQVNRFLVRSWWFTPEYSQQPIARPFPPFPLISKLRHLLSGKRFSLVLRKHIRRAFRQLADRDNSLETSVRQSTFERCVYFVHHKTNVSCLMSRIYVVRISICHVKYGNAWDLSLNFKRDGLTRR